MTEITEEAEILNKDEILNKLHELQTRLDELKGNPKSEVKEVAEEHPADPLETAKKQELDKEALLKEAENNLLYKKNRAEFNKNFEKFFNDDEMKEIAIVDNLLKETEDYRLAKKFEIMFKNENNFNYLSKNSQEKVKEFFSLDFKNQEGKIKDLFSPITEEFIEMYGKFELERLKFKPKEEIITNGREMTPYEKSIFTFKKV